VKYGDQTGTDRVDHGRVSVGGAGAAARRVENGLRPTEALGTGSTDPAPRQAREAQMAILTDIVCPREKSFMTLCVARDGRMALTLDHECAGCKLDAAGIADELTITVRGFVELKERAG
jgi:hypothetical protein